MKKIILLFQLIFVCGYSQNENDKVSIVKNYDIDAIKTKALEFKKRANVERLKAYDLANKNGWPIIISKGDSIYQELIRIAPDGTPIYYSTDNLAAAISTRANLLQTGGGMGLNLNGQGMVARVWDGGRTRLTHNLLNTRVTTVDDIESTTFSNHATHVTGTVIASSTNASLRGMAPQATARTFNWTDDESEALQEVLDGMLISNHSYGIPMVNTSGVQLPGSLIGSYLQDARDWDEIAYLSPFYLPVKSAGNNGNNINNEGIAFGFDKLTGNKVAKNALIVANAQDAVVNAAGVLTSPLNINLGSSQGPTDDLRIKPDITGNGTSVLSASGTSNSATATLSGTSMSAPNVSGTLLLVQQHHKNKTNNFMKSATLKGLATHTADDSGNVGPDATFGWGLLNGKKCVETIDQNGLNSWISEEVLNNGQTFTMNVNSNGTQPLIASITWTDLPGPVNTTGVANSPLRALVNDLDIRIVRGASTFFPWRLNETDVSNIALNDGDNNRDNLENVTINNPAAGNYTITVTHKGNLVSNKQAFSLVITGVNSTFSLNSTSTDLTICSNQNASYTFNYTSTGVGTTNFSAVGLPAGSNATFSPTSLSSNGLVTMNITNLSSVPAGIYNIGIVGTRGTETETRYRELRLFSTTISPITLDFPANIQNDLAPNTRLKWLKEVNAENYALQVATDPLFNNILLNQLNITSNEYNLTNLTPNTAYYWRVIPSNRCASGNVASAAVRVFYTGLINNCNLEFSATDFSNSAIANTADSNASVPITVTGGHKIGDLNVILNISHEYVQDMFVSLIGPSSIGSPEVFLLANTCGEFNDVNATFDDAGLDVSCSSTPPSIAGTIKSVSALSQFNNLIADGVWTLKVDDPYNGDGGNINSATISICALTPSPLSTNKFELNKFELYPNPTKGIINIDFKQLDQNNNSIKVFDIQGRLVLDKKVNSLKESVNLNNYSKGVYLFVIQNGENKTTKKVILDN